MKIIYHLAKAFSHFGIAMITISEKLFAFADKHKKEDSSDE